MIPFCFFSSVVSHPFCFTRRSLLFLLSFDSLLSGYSLSSFFSLASACSPALPFLTFSSVLVCLILTLSFAAFHSFPFLPAVLFAPVGLPFLGAALLHSPCGLHAGGCRFRHCLCRIVHEGTSQLRWWRFFVVRGLLRHKL